MNKEFVPYQPSLDMKELGFDEPCFVKIWWLNDFNVNTKEQFEPHITMNGDDIKFKYQFPENHPLNKGDILKLEIPTFSQAFRWFREKHNLHAEPYTADMGAIEYCFQIRDLYSERYIYDNFVGAGSSYMGTFNTPEEAELACLIKLIEIVKSK